jgi:hypothetical protein
MKASKKLNSAGYSLIELSIAAGVVVAGVAAAAALALNTAQIEDINYRKGRVIAISEGAARLWQLGLTPSQARALLLGDPALESLTFNDTAGDPTAAVPTDRGTAITDPTTDLGQFEAATLRAVVRTREDAGTSAPAVTETLNPIMLIR